MSDSDARDRFFRGEVSEFLSREISAFRSESTAPPAAVADGGNVVRLNRGAPGRRAFSLWRSRPSWVLACVLWVSGVVSLGFLSFVGYKLLARTPPSASSTVISLTGTSAVVQPPAVRVVNKQSLDPLAPPRWTMAPLAIDTTGTEPPPAVSPRVERWWAEWLQYQAHSGSVRAMPRVWHWHHHAWLPVETRQPSYYVGGCPPSVCLPKRTGGVP